MTNMLDRFLKYVSFETTSDEASGTCPSTERQLALGNYLVEELSSLGCLLYTSDAADDGEV